MMSPIISICANARGAWPDAAEIVALGVGGIRTIVYDNDEFEVALAQLPPGVKVVAMLNNEHQNVGAHFENWASVIVAFASRFDGRVLAIECANELDIFGEAPELGASLVRDAKRAIDTADANIKILLSSVAGPNWPDWLEKAAKLCVGYADGVCLHPYGKTPDDFTASALSYGSIRDAVATAHSLTGLPVWLTESGVKIGDAGGVVEQAHYVEDWVRTMRSIDRAVMPFASYFAWRDDVGGPSEQGDSAFGLRMPDTGGTKDGARRQAYFSFKETMQSTTEVTAPMSLSVWGDAPSPDAHFTLGFADWAQREPALIGAPHDAKEFGAAPGISQQRTTRGLLTWANLKAGEVMIFLDATNGKRYVWDGVSPYSTEIRDDGTVPIGNPPIIAPPPPPPAPTPAPAQPAPDASLLDYWHAVRDDVDYAPGTAISDLWTTDPYRFGPPLGPERETKDADGTVTEVYQTFTNARLIWRAGDAGASVA